MKYLLSVSNSNIAFVPSASAGYNEQYELLINESTIETTGGIPEAPTDGKTYGRKNAGWAEVQQGGGGGIPDAPSNNKLYGRKNNEWEEITGGGTTYEGGEGINIEGNEISIIPATASTLGGVKQGIGITISPEGVISATGSESSMFELEGDGSDENPFIIKAKYDLYSLGEITAGGVGIGGEGNGGVLRVVAEIEGSTVTLDKTYSEMKAAFESGILVYVDHNGEIFLPIVYFSEAIAFAMIRIEQGSFEIQYINCSNTTPESVTYSSISYGYIVPVTTLPSSRGTYSESSILLITSGTNHGHLYKWGGSSWEDITVSGSGGSYTAGNGISIVGNEISVQSASHYQFGGVKIGSGLEVDSSGYLNNTGGGGGTYTGGTGIDISGNVISLKQATISGLGGVKLGEGINIKTNGQIYIEGGTGINVNPSNDKINLLPPDGTTIGGVYAGANITIADDGKISSTGGGGTEYTAGDGIKIQNNTISILPPSNNKLGGVYAGDNITIDTTGRISATGGSGGGVTGVKGNSEASYRTGNVNITPANIGLGNVENTALSTWTGSSNINTVGTITSGVWHGSAIGDSYISSSSSWNTAASNISQLKQLFESMFELDNSGSTPLIRAKLGLYSIYDVVAGGADSSGIRSNIPIESSIPSGGAVAGTMYSLGTLSSNTTISLKTPTNMGFVNRWMFQFSFGSTARTVTFTPTVTWKGTPSYNANKTYQVTITLVDGKYLGEAIEF